MGQLVRPIVLGMAQGALFVSGAFGVSSGHVGPDRAVIFVAGFWMGHTIRGLVAGIPPRRDAIPGPLRSALEEDDR